MTGREFRDNALHAEKILREESEVSNQEADHLVRFRADPSKVRVSVRPRGESFLLRIEDRRDPKRNNVETVDSDPKAGLTYLLNVAEKHIDGISLEMDHEYSHPMKVAQ